MKEEIPESRALAAGRSPVPENYHIANAGKMMPGSPVEPPPRGNLTGQTWTFGKHFGDMSDLGGVKLACDPLTCDDPSHYFYTPSSVLPPKMTNEYPHVCNRQGFNPAMGDYCSRCLTANNQSHPNTCVCPDCWPRPADPAPPPPIDDYAFGLGAEEHPIDRLHRLKRKADYEASLADAAPPQGQQTVTCYHEDAEGKLTPYEVPALRAEPAPMTRPVEPRKLNTWEQIDSFMSRYKEDESLRVGGVKDLLHMYGERLLTAATREAVPPPAEPASKEEV